jgi:hypothetical protein
MKKILTGIDKDGKAVVRVKIDGTKVKFLSQDKRFAELHLKPMKLRCRKLVGGINADGFIVVRPGDAEYSKAVIDTLEGMGLDVVG